MIIKPNLSKVELENYKKRFSFSNGYDCSVRENIWRRHQCKENSNLSGWINSKDCRRRLIHFIDQYEIKNNNFCLSKCYLNINLFLPVLDCLQYEEFLSKTKINDDFFSLNFNSVKVNSYNELNITLKSNNFNVTNEISLRPFNVFNKGIRKFLLRGNPKYIKISDIGKYFPAHIELGCGPSIDAGIPPLNYFHKLFSLSKNNKFVFSFKDDDLIKSIVNPFDWYTKTSYIQKMCLQANPTKFYFKLKQLIEEKKVFEPIFNNNFDGLSKSLDIDELCLRQYDSSGEYPNYSFCPEAKSLIVIGSHADRRGCQAAARKAGLQIIFIDPEGYFNNGSFISYPLEAPQDNDLVLSLTADDFASQL